MNFAFNSPTRALFSSGERARNSDSARSPETKNNQPEGSVLQSQRKVFSQSRSGPDVLEMGDGADRMERTVASQAGTCVRDLSRTTQNPETQRQGTRSHRVSRAGRRFTSRPEVTLKDGVTEAQTLEVAQRVRVVHRPRNRCPVCPSGALDNAKVQKPSVPVAKARSR